MLGYMTEKQAKAEGFTHHGSYYGIPCWIGDPEGDCMVATKWAPLDFIIPIFSMVEGLLWPLIHGDSEPMFVFKVTGEIQ